MTFQKGYSPFSAKPLVPASEAAVIEAQATADAALAASPAPDGSPPATNPTISVRPGIGSLFVVWEPITNADPVTYDVYAVPAADAARLAYPPLSTDRVGEAVDTGAAFRALPDGTDLTPAESYAVAVYARDADGQCTTSATPVTASPAQVTSEDLALNALTVGHLTGNDALFIALQAEEIVGVNITGSTFRTGTSGSYWRLGAGPYGSVAIEGMSDASPSMAVQPGIYNQSQAGDPGDGRLVQQARIQLQSGDYYDDLGVVVPSNSAGVQVLTQRQQVTAGGVWALPTTNITIDAKGNEGSVDLSADHITFTNYVYDGDDSMEFLAGSLLLSGAYGVTIDGPTVDITSPVTINGGLTVDGVPYSGAASVGKTARLRKTAAQSTANGAWTILTFDADAPAPYVVSSSWFTYSAGTFTCVTSGFYSLTAAVLFASGAAGTRRIISIVRNGVRWIRNDGTAKATAAAAAGVTVSDSIYFDAGDTLRIEVYQDSGAALNTTSADGSDYASLSITRTA